MAEGSLLGRVLWHELLTNDVAAAETFYSTLFGWKQTGAMDMGPMGQVLNGPTEVPGGDWIVNAVDPQGEAFSLYHKKP